VPGRTAATGGEHDETNLVTACYMCQLLKQNWGLEELCSRYGWEERVGEPAEWDGLSNSLEELVSLLPVSEQSTYKKWIEAIRAQNERGGK
jgi:hypothetical protein